MVKTDENDKTTTRTMYRISIFLKRIDHGDASKGMVSTCGYQSMMAIDFLEIYIAHHSPAIPKRNTYII